MELLYLCKGALVRVVMVDRRGMVFDASALAQSKHNDEAAHPLLMPPFTLHHTPPFSLDKLLHTLH